MVLVFWRSVSYAFSGILCCLRFVFSARYFCKNTLGTMDIYFAVSLIDEKCKLLSTRSLENLTLQLLSKLFSSMFAAMRAS